jgi:CDGSH-type Zn-finger protein
MTLSLTKEGFIMSKVQIKVNDNGSFRVTGDVELIDAEGNKFETKETFSLCRCALSQKMPFCDGSHKGKFQSVVRANQQ